MHQRGLRLYSAAFKVNTTDERMSPFKRRRTLKRHREELLLLPDDVVELILKRLPVESLLRFRSVSKKLKSAIDFRRFQERQMLRGGDPDVLFVATNCYNDDGRLVKEDEDARTYVFGSSSRSMCLLIGVALRSIIVLVTVYYASTLLYNSSLCVLMNPATRRQQTFPLISNIQNLLIKRLRKNTPTPKLGFGKDKLTGTYKPVFLTNSSGFGLDDVTTCEVFDFTTQRWRYIHP
ncbi:unnamed protein product, partial [Brassica oleracea var. botrytis]